MFGTVPVGQVITVDWDGVKPKIRKQEAHLPAESQNQLPRLLEQNRGERK